MPVFLRKMVCFCLINFFLLAGCAPVQEQEALPVLAEPVDYLPIYFSETRPLAPLEPESGCITGAFLPDTALSEEGVAAFESAMQKEHGLYAKKMRIGDPFPLYWVLECYANGKLPMLTLLPADASDPFALEDMEATAQDFRAFDIPILVQFFPGPSAYGTAKEYVDFFCRSRELFRQKAPNSVFVWSVWEDAVTSSVGYYPGDDAVDWIGLSWLQKSGEQGASTGFLWWYFTYQAKKPLMLAPLGVSHYSTRDTKYTEVEAAKEIERIYASLPYYPAVKAVVYRNEKAGAPVRKAEQENYAVTENDRVRAAYQKAVAAPWFSKKEGERLRRSAFWAAETGGRRYLSVHMLAHELGFSDLKEQVSIAGEAYVAADAFPGLVITEQDGQLLLHQRESQAGLQETP